GTVSAEEDLALIERMAQSVRAESFVRYVAPERTPGRGGTIAPPVSPAAGGTSTATTPGSAALPLPTPGAVAIEYDVQVIETSVTFGTSSYETGIEPSGRVLHKTKVRAPLGGSVEVFVPGKSLASKDLKVPANEMETGGIRLTLTPAELDDQQLSTRILVETNLPINSPSYVPGGWRRARWEAANAITAPFSVAGADLLVIPELSTGGGAMSKISSAGRILGGIPGVSSLPGGRYANSVPYYNKDKKTHLLVLLHARLVAAQ
ncbi:MAG: hypothetical protein ABI039_11925, partial [Vicinamibacterales bacterium]